MFIRRRDAVHFIETDRAVYVGRDPDGQDQIRLIETHPKNQPRSVPGYDDIKDFFEWAIGTSNGSAVMKARRIPCALLVARRRSPSEKKRDKIIADQLSKRVLRQLLDRVIQNQEVKLQSR